MSKEWTVAVRLEDTPETRGRIAKLQEHAWLKYRKQPGGMVRNNTSEFVRFLINYYRSREKLGGEG